MHEPIRIFSNPIKLKTENPHSKEFNERLFQSIQICDNVFMKYYPIYLKMKEDEKKMKE